MSVEHGVDSGKICGNCANCWVAELDLNAYIGETMSLIIYIYIYTYYIDIPIKVTEFKFLSSNSGCAYAMSG